MDDFRIDSLGFDDSFYEQREDGSKQRPKRKQVEPQEEPTDEVVLSSDGDGEEQPFDYLPGRHGADTPLHISHHGADTPLHISHHGADTPLHISHHGADTPLHISHHGADTPLHINSPDEGESS